jgi:hypothetical protein
MPARSHQSHGNARKAEQVEGGGGPLLLLLLLPLTYLTAAGAA